MIERQTAEPAVKQVYARLRVQVKMGALAAFNVRGLL